MSVGNINKGALRMIVMSIENLDRIESSKDVLYNNMNIYRLKEARRNLYNIIYSCGYDIEPFTYKLILVNKELLP